MIEAFEKKKKKLLDEIKFFENSFKIFQNSDKQNYRFIEIVDKLSVDNVVKIMILDYMKTTMQGDGLEYAISNVLENEEPTSLFEHISSPKKKKDMENIKIGDIFEFKYLGNDRRYLGVINYNRDNDLLYYYILKGDFEQVQESEEIRYDDLLMPIPFRNNDYYKFKEFEFKGINLKLNEELKCSYLSEPVDEMGNKLEKHRNIRAFDKHAYDAYIGFYIQVWSKIIEPNIDSKYLKDLILNDYEVDEEKMNKILSNPEYKEKFIEKLNNIQFKYCIDYNPLEHEDVKLELEEDEDEGTFILEIDFEVLYKLGKITAEIEEELGFEIDAHGPGKIFLKYLKKKEVYLENIQIDELTMDLIFEGKDKKQMNKIKKTLESFINSKTLYKKELINYIEDKKADSN